jgi:hypothetical protein
MKPRLFLAACIISLVHVSTSFAQTDISGKWTFTGKSNVFPLAFSATGTMSQIGISLSGQLTMTGTPCAGLGGLATFTGAVNYGTPAFLSVNVNEAGQIVLFNGTVSSDGNSMSGTYAAPSGGCTNGDRGTWSGQRTSTTLPRVGSFAQVASGGGWKTSMTLVNLSPTNLATASINFHANDGSPLPLPLSFPQSGATITDSSAKLTIPPMASIVVETEAATSSVSIGWADVQSSAASLRGYAVFRLRSSGFPDLEGTVQLETGTPSSSLTLVYDNTDGFETGFAVANLGLVSTSMTISAYSDESHQ